MIGPAAHYVTEDLDDGPIIEQKTVQVSHSDEASDLNSEGPRHGTAGPCEGPLFSFATPGDGVSRSSSSFRVMGLLV